MIQHIKIRRAIKSDAQDLSKLILENANSTLLPHYNEEQWAVFTKYYSIEETEKKIKEWVFFCADIEGEIAGAVALNNNFVVGFYTKLAFLRKGIGQMLMKHIEEYASQNDISELQLAASPEGLEFYLKHDWKKIKARIFYHYGVGFEETLMSKNLK